MLNKGTVKWFNEVRGFGCIVGDSGEDVFVHHSQIRMDGFRTLDEGQTVSYDLETSDRGLKAVNVSLIYESE
jgi:CspA family cold shock protein